MCSPEGQLDELFQDLLALYDSQIDVISQTDGNKRVSEDYYKEKGHPVF